LCSALFASTCDDALGDQRFWFGGVPLAGWGLVYFTGLSGLLFVARFVRGGFEPEALTSGTLLAVAGTAVGLALTVSAGLGWAPTCPLCLTVHGVNALLLLALRRAHPRSAAQQLRMVRAAWDWLRGSGAPATESARWTLVGHTSVALLAALVFQWVYVESALRGAQAARPPARAQIIAIYSESPRLALPVDGDDPHLGPLTAPVRLVVFESFRCSGCRRLSGTLSRLRDRFRDRLLIVYKHYPLSTTCNGRLARDLQPGACEVAWAAQAAHRQARFWAFYDALWASGMEALPESIAETARRANLDSTRFAADWQSESTKDRVAADIALGTRLKIPGTPAVFLDGRLVVPVSAEILETLIRYELGREKRGAAG